MSPLLGICALGASLGLPADLRGTWALSDRSDVVLREVSRVSEQALDLATTPGLRLSLNSKRENFYLTYAPRFTVRDAAGERVPDLFQTASIGVVVARRQHTLTLSQDGSYGKILFSAQPLSAGSASSALPSSDTPREGGGISPLPAPGSRLELVPLPLSKSIQMVTSRTAISWSYYPTHRWLFGVGASYFASGGLGQDAQTYVPLQRGPRGEMSVGFALSPRNHLFTAIAASRLDFEQHVDGGATAARLATADGRSYTTLEASETWVSHLSPVDETQVTVGAKDIASRGDGSLPLEHRPYPTGSVGYRRRLPAPDGAGTEVRASVTVGPIVNSQIGIIDDRLDLTLSGDHHRGRWTFTGSVGFGAVFISDASRGRLVSSLASASYRASRVVSLEWGVRASYSKYDVAPSLFQEALFFAVTARDIPRRF